MLSKFLGFCDAPSADLLYPVTRINPKIVIVFVRLLGWGPNDELMPAKTITADLLDFDEQILIYKTFSK